MPKKSTRSPKAVRKPAKKSRQNSSKFSTYALRKIRAAGMAPPQSPLSPAEFAKLQQQWYSKLSDDPDWQDIEWVDHSTGLGHNSPHLRGSLAGGKAYHPGRELYMDLASNYLVHCRSLRNNSYNYFIWKMHVNGATYDAIMQALKSEYRGAPSKYTVFYDIQALAKLCFKWNCTHPEGLFVKRREDLEALQNSPLADLYATQYNWILGGEPID